MQTAFAGVEWDDGNRDKCGKHGVPLVEIEHLLLHGERLLLDDHRHSGEERRFIAIGRTREGRHAFVVFTGGSTVTS